jgi:hypothetical protein
MPMPVLLTILKGLPIEQLLARRWQGAFGVLEHLELGALTGRL